MRGGRDRVLLAGVSTRAAAASAARAGYDVTALDAFADLDQEPRVRALSIVRDFGRRYSAAAAARASHALDVDAVAYLGTFENHPGAVQTLSRGRTLWGNPPGVLRQVRDPFLLAATLRWHGLPAPWTVAHDPNDPNVLNDSNVPNVPNVSNEWLVKPLASGGGRGVRRWIPGCAVPATSYVQERIDGVPGSVVFVAAGGRAVTLGVSRQLVGDCAFGASGFRYCGSILAADRAWRARADMLASTVSRAFGLVGVNGVDFIDRRGELVAIEVNPRWTASMELVERASGVSVFGLHAAACTRGLLPEAPAFAGAQTGGTLGKAVLFARRSLIVGDTRPWLNDPDVADVPRAGERIPAGGPICTVFSRASDEAACRAALVGTAERVFARVGIGDRGKDP